MSQNGRIGEPVWHVYAPTITIKDYMQWLPEICEGYELHNKLTLLRITCSTARSRESHLFLMMTPQRWKGSEVKGPFHLKSLATLQGCKISRWLYQPCSVSPILQEKRWYHPNLLQTQHWINNNCPLTAVLSVSNDSYSKFTLLI